MSTALGPEIIQFSDYKKNKKSSTEYHESFNMCRVWTTNNMIKEEYVLLPKLRTR